MSKKKKKSSEEAAEKDGFMMMFVTLSMILLAFFILLNSMAVMDDRKVRSALGSLLGSFGMLSGSDSVANGKEPTLQQEAIIGSDGVLQIFEQMKVEIEKLKQDADFGEEAISAEYDNTTGEIKIVLTEHLVFPAGTAVISLKVFPLLDRIALIAKNSGGDVMVTGHTDSRKTKGQSSNWKLSLERGTIVARHIEASAGLPRGKVQSSGASFYKPIAENKTEKGRAKNRRVEVLIKTEEG